MRAAALALLLITLGYSVHPIAKAIDKEFINPNPCEQGLWMPVTKVAATWQDHEYPLTLLIHSELPEDIRDVIIIAASKWNAHLGFEVFEAYLVREEEWVDLGYSKRQVRINFSEVPLPINHIAETIHIWNLFDYRGVLRVDISILHYIMGHKYWYETMLHELGHVLGLGHDNEDKGSIMFPQTRKNRQFIRSNDVKYIQDARLQRPICKQD